MAKKLNSVVGIDIGSRKIKVCEIKTQGKEPVVTALGIIDTPEGAVDSGGIYNDEAVALALKQVLNSSGIATKAVVVSIAGQNSVLVRTLEVPRMNPQELRDHMQWEINRNIPFAESTVVSDFKPLGDEDPNSPNMDVVMAIAPQSAIDTTVSCIKRAGAQTAAIDVEPLSMARSVARSYDDELGGKTVCLVDMGASSCAINIYSGSKLLMPRQIPLGGDMFTKAIADDQTLSLGDAEQLKVTRMSIPANAAELQQGAMNPFDVPGMPTQEFQPFNPFADDVPVYQQPAPTAYGTTTGYGEGDPLMTLDEQPPAADPYAVPSEPVFEPTPEPTSMVPAPVPAVDDETMRLYKAVAPLLDEFVAEVRRSVDYFRSRGGDVDVIELAGGGCKIPGLPDFLTQMVGVQCDAYDPLRRLTVNARKVAPDFLEAHRQEFAVAVGNGLHIFFD
ncbi:type IV pilus assembly protein PilM [bacterium]|nr:MAG: type IV pilus assembly protein PilM [bacterium]